MKIPKSIMFQMLLLGNGDILILLNAGNAVGAGSCWATLTKLLKDWTSDLIKVIVATKAFSIGIDKPNVGLVIHYNISESMEAW